MKLAIITSNHLRHKYLIDQLSQHFSVAGVLIEEKKRDYSKKGEGTILENDVKTYFDARSVSEKEFFDNVNWPLNKTQIGEVVTVEAGSVNEEKYISTLRKWNPDYLAVFGSSILKEGIIDLFPDRIINMHLGLSPYYRGSGTNFWPLYNEKPEYVGVTIHYLDKGIDSGKIIVQGRPEIVHGDTPHSIGNKTIIRGVELMMETFQRFEKGEKLSGVVQDTSDSKLCLFKDCLPEHIIELQKKWDKGLVDSYLKRIRESTYHAPKIIQFIS